MTTGLVGGDGLRTTPQTSCSFVSIQMRLFAECSPATGWPVKNTSQRYSNNATCV